MDEIYDTLELADKVRRLASKEFGIDVEMERIPNPRIEKEEHYYEVEHKLLPSLGFKRKKEIDEVLREIFETVLSNRDRASRMKSLIYPTVDWRVVETISSKMFKKVPRRLLTVNYVDSADGREDSALREIDQIGLPVFSAE